MALPGKDVCREIREQSSTLPIVVLSAVTEQADKVLLLGLGADEYITKPLRAACIAPESGGFEPDR